MSTVVIVMLHCLCRLCFPEGFPLKYATESAAIFTLEMCFPLIAVLEISDALVSVSLTVYDYCTFDRILI